ncbi:hypothetical protein ANO11243_022590 [Dothideomycetidae sp. 11243]|nr:hypothetical protein ANO11243_022590 [fungal sp. No.11243]
MDVLRWCVEVGKVVVDVVQHCLSLVSCPPAHSRLAPRPSLSVCACVCVCVSSPPGLHLVTRRNCRSPHAPAVTHRVQAPLRPSSTFGPWRSVFDPSLIATPRCVVSPCGARRPINGPSMVPFHQLPFCTLWLFPDCTRSNMSPPSPPPRTSPPEPTRPPIRSRSSCNNPSPISSTSPSPASVKSTSHRIHRLPRPVGSAIPSPIRRSIRPTTVHSRPCPLPPLLMGPAGRSERQPLFDSQPAS